MMMIRSLALVILLSRVTGNAAVTDEPFGAESIGQMTQTWRVPQAYPEGIAYDKANQRVLLSSVLSNTIAALDVSNNMALKTTYAPPSGNPSGVGLKVDNNGRVHAMITNFPANDNGGYSVYDLAVTEPETAEATIPSGTIYFPCTNGESGCGQGSDIVFTPDGIAYMTDSYNGRVFKVENGVMEEISSDPLLKWADEKFPVGANGLVYDQRGFLIVGNSATMSLIKIDLHTNGATKIETEGEFGVVDGMLIDSRGRIFATTEKTMYVLQESDDDWASARVVGTIDLDHSYEGEIATTAAFGEDENEIYVTFVRFWDLMGEGPNEKPSLLGKIVLKGNDVAETIEEALNGSTSEF